MRLATTLFILFLTTGCMLWQDVAGNCDCVCVGDDVDTVCQRAGRPYQIVNCGDGKQQYIYINRDDPALHVQRMQKCILEIENGVVINKYNETEDYEDISVMDEQMFPKY